jgi:hypothetical protein
MFSGQHANKESRNLTLFQSPGFFSFRQVREVKYNVEEVASLSEQEMVKPLHFREFLRMG